MVSICEEGRHYRCEGYSITPGGKHMAILYRSAPSPEWDKLVDQKHHLFVYELFERANVEYDNDTSWGKAVTNFSFESRYLVYCPQPLAFDTDYTIICPYGRINIFSGSIDQSFSPLSGHKVLDSVQSLKSSESFGGVAFVAQNQTQVLLDRLNRKLIRLQLSDGSSVTATLPCSEAVMACVSPLGSFVVLQDTKSHTTCLLHDFTTNTTKSLRNSEWIEKPFGSRLRFSADEQCLIAIFPPSDNRANAHIGKWIGLSEKAEARISTGLVNIYGFYLSKIDEPAYLATSDNWIKVDLQYLRTPLSHNNMLGFVCKQQVSVDGDCLVVIIHPLRDPKRH
ncbi:MAG: hypothetical protein Q9191_005571, partial [Dirinaria sp. TL-2023a]